MRRSIILRLVAAACALVLGSALGAPQAVAAANDNGSGPSTLSTPSGSLVGAGWQQFNWGADGLSNEAFKLATRHRVFVTVTDVFCPGDAFKVKSKWKVLARTPVVEASPACDYPGYTDNPDVALNDPAYSHKSFWLKPGQYLIRLKAYVNPFGVGGGYIRFDRCRYQPQPTVVT